MKNHHFRILKSGGYPETFSKKKLFTSLKRTGLANKQCQMITEKVSQDIGEGTQTKKIFNQALKLVNENSPLAAVNYSLKRAIFDLGPAGHHFETFVACYFQELGYETETCQILPGRLVNHEVDVVAYKTKKLSFVECKFHNRIGIKNDIKTALYVKARRDDLKQGPRGKQLEAFYLASNTAFSLDAIKYANGSKILLLGVNAPPERSFLDEIKAMKLYPITSLKRLNRMIRNELLDRNIVTIKEIPQHLNLLSNLGMNEEDIAALLHEVEFLTGSKS